MSNPGLKENKRHTILGVMSGTSLDGLDIASCTFEISGNAYKYVLNECVTIPYTTEWRNRLAGLPKAGSREYAATHAAYGSYIGSMILNFIMQYSIDADFVASHGHTIFHQPHHGFTAQIGDGAAIAATCGLPVISDFRSGDVAHGGQGAPLVPVGDELLFGKYSHCLNLGGFANISYTAEGKRIAFDICPVNYILNHLASLAGQVYDRDGGMAASGNIDHMLLAKLNALPFYTLAPPKSLGREWVENEVLPLFHASDASLNDLMSTAVEHIALQLSNCIEPKMETKLLITGGGAYNHFLMRRLESLTSLQISLPEKKLVEFKEALIFAFLGLLRFLEKPNCRSSVTGASQDVCGGAIYLP